MVIIKYVQIGNGDVFYRGGTIILANLTVIMDKPKLLFQNQPKKAVRT
jgi:hypothetical protein